MKKIIAIALILVLLLAGCTPATQNATKPAEIPKDATPLYDPKTTTRADLEKALTEVAFDFLLKGSKIQYDSMELNLSAEDGNSLGKYYGGMYRLTEGVSLEYGTSDTTIFTVCSDYCWKVYNNALGYPLMGHSLNAVTDGLHRYSELENMALLRWISSDYNGTGKLSDYDKECGVTEKLLVSEEEARQFIRDYDKNLRPGDIIVVSSKDSGHALLYIGGGYVLDSTGGKYNTDTGKDDPEPSGSVYFPHDVIKLFVEGTDEVRGDNSYIGDAGIRKRLTILRPLNALCIDDGDSDPSNDKLNTEYVLPDYVTEKGTLKFPENVVRSGYAITNATATRLHYPGLEIDRTVDITTYGTAVPGEKLTYSVKLSNFSSNKLYCKSMSKIYGTTYSGQDYAGLVVTETIPAGTKLVEGSISHGGVLKDNVITWSVNIPAGEQVDLTYRVEVTAQVGTVITNGGGTVGQIPSNTISNLVVKSGLNDTLQKKLQALTTTETSGWTGVSASDTDIALANKLYSGVLGVDLALPDCKTLLSTLFTKSKIEIPEGYHLRPDKKIDHTEMFTLTQGSEAIRQMLIPGYYGGTEVYTPDASLNRITEFHMDYLLPGDIVVYLDGADAECLYDANSVDVQLAVYLGEGKIAMVRNKKLVCTKADAFLTEALIHSAFFALRPSQAYSDINTGTK